MMKRRYYGSCLMLVAGACAFGPLSSNVKGGGNNRNKIRSDGHNDGNFKHARIRYVGTFSAASDEDLTGAGAGGSRANSAFSRNEFSRILHIDRIFRNRRRSDGNNQQQRDHTVTVNADESECRALAKRLDLKNLTRLTADLSFRPAAEALVASAGGSSLPVEAEGTIEAHLTQTCVRTNEEFEVDVEFPLYAVVKPVAANNDEDLRRLFLQQQEEEAAAAASGKKTKKKHKKKPKQDVFHENKKEYNLADVFDLQTAIQEADFFGDDEGGAADLVEDEAIYSLSSEQLDVGELIAQTFYLQLDPFPKKPGSDPISWEISG